MVKTLRSLPKLFKLRKLCENYVIKMASSKASNMFITFRFHILTIYVYNILFLPWVLGFFAGQKDVTIGNLFRSFLCLGEGKSVLRNELDMERIESRSSGRDFKHSLNLI